jgi:hypothetical protein
MSTIQACSQELYTVDNVRQRLQNQTVECIRTIASDTTHRINGYIKNKQLLDSGIFYPYDYYIALKELHSTKRLDFLKSRGCFYHGYVPADIFEQQEHSNEESRSYVKNMGFTLSNKQVPASEALALISGNKQGQFLLLGCAEVCQIAQYRAVLDVIGQKKFDFLFAANSWTPLMIGAKLENNPIGKLRNYMLEDYTSSFEFQKGDAVNFQNASSYDISIVGEASSYNAFCIDPTKGCEKFVSLGTDSNGLTATGFSNLLFEKRNEKFVFDHLPEPYRQYLSKRYDLQKSATTPPLTWEQFLAEDGGKMKILGELDAGKVTLLANSSIEKSREIMDSFKVEITHKRS